jgi:hypothetical protein
LLKVIKWLGFPAFPLSFSGILFPTAFPTWLENIGVKQAGLCACAD